MHLYLHVPFCARRCSYCDFAIAVRRTVPSERYAEAVLKEWQRCQSDPAWLESPRLDTIYLGGGTPSLLSNDALGAILARLTSDRALGADPEITLEANPDDVNEARADAWRAIGINRISLGVQSFDPGVLRWMHRTHTAEQVRPAMAALRRAGFENISCDLIYALPADLQRDWDADLQTAIALQPEHLSLYGLTVEPHTPLGAWVDRGRTAMVAAERYADEFLRAHELVAAADFEHYEVSNYARPGRRAIHNAAYWRRAPYLGLGPSAHSGLGRSRRWNLREWAQYERAIAQGADPVAGQEVLDPVALRIEELYLGLRTDAGVAAERIPEQQRRAWQAQGWAVEQSAQVRLTAEGWLRLDALVATLV
jgi:oxygen-independent coproporphyrinogen-3 oxidase